MYLTRLIDIVINGHSLESPFALLNHRNAIEVKRDILAFLRQFLEKITLRNALHVRHHTVHLTSALFLIQLKIELDFGIAFFLPDFGFNILLQAMFFYFGVDLRVYSYLETRLRCLKGLKV